MDIYLHDISTFLVLSNHLPITRWYLLVKLVMLNYQRVPTTLKMTLPFPSFFSSSFASDCDLVKLLYNLHQLYLYLAKPRVMRVFFTTNLAIYLTTGAPPLQKKPISMTYPYKIHVYMSLYIYIYIYTHISLSLYDLPFGAEAMDLV